MNISKEEAQNYINNTIVPMAMLTTTRACSVFKEDMEALEIAYTSGNTTLVFAMANYIFDLAGLINGSEVAQAITAKIFD